MNIGIAGNGNAAWHFCKMLELRGHHIAEVYSRNGATMSSAPNAIYFNDPSLFTSACDMVFIAVSDDAIADVSSKINKDLFAVHVSGNTSIDLLCQNAKGVAWPVQSLTKEKEVNYAEIPFLIEASDLEAEKKLFDLFLSISERTITADSSKRSVVHLAAVFANNFVNHLYDVADDILLKQDLSFNLLIPIIQNQVDKIAQLSPQDAQTGPAKRGDMTTISRHLKMLENSPEYQTIYRTLTNSILEHFHGKKL